MQRVVIITATMADGTVIRELVRAFEPFTAVALAFRADPDCVRLVWHVADPPPPPALSAALGRLPLSQAAALATGLAQLATIDPGDPDASGIPW